MLGLLGFIDVLFATHARARLSMLLEPWLAPPPSLLPAPRDDQRTAAAAATPAAAPPTEGLRNGEDPTGWLGGPEVPLDAPSLEVHAGDWVSWQAAPEQCRR